MAKLTPTRVAVLRTLAMHGGGQSFGIARNLKIAQTSIQSALQWLRRNDLAYYNGHYWVVTEAGRAALAKESGQ